MSNVVAFTCAEPFAPPGGLIPWASSGEYTITSYAQPPLYWPPSGYQQLVGSHVTSSQNLNGTVSWGSPQTITLTYVPAKVIGIPSCLLQYNCAKASFQAVQPAAKPK